MFRLIWRKSSNGTQTRRDAGNRACEEGKERRSPVCRGDLEIARPWSGADKIVCITVFIVQRAKPSPLGPIFDFEWQLHDDPLFTPMTAPNKLTEGLFIGCSPMSAVEGNASANS